MITLNINPPSKSYPIFITDNYNLLGKCMIDKGIEPTEKVVIVTDTNVEQYYCESCIRSLEESGYEVYKYVVKAGEASKSLETVNSIYNFLVNIYPDRNMSIVALGGGVVGDITGFVASTFLRGIKFIQVPTSLVAQADSSVGGKVGVDLNGHKNIIGSFYQPEMVYINVNSLKTLPERELKSGLAEVLVHGIIKDAELFEFIGENSRKIFSFDEEVLKHIVKVNCKIKGQVVEVDEKDCGIRAILNFGHTFGHAIETASNFRLSHGESVAIGVIGAFKLAHYLNVIDLELVNNVTKVLQNIGLPVSFSDVDTNEIYKCMLHDKKVQKNKIFFILPKRIGEVYIHPVEDTELIKKVINELCL